MPGPFVRIFQDDIAELGKRLDAERAKMNTRFGYCQPDGHLGCARMTLKRWFGKCPDCPCLVRSKPKTDEQREIT